MNLEFQNEVDDIFLKMTVAELKGLVKHLGWDKESEMQRFPDWYGIEGIKFIWHNEWTDPEIEYKGRRCSCYVVEDTLWDEYTHDDDGFYIVDSNEDEFEQWVKENAEHVKYLCELALFPEEVNI